VLVPAGDSLVFHLTARQKRTQRIIAAVSAPTGAALAGLGTAADKYVIGYVLMLAAAIALYVVYRGLNNARAFTECTPSSLRARTVLGRLREWPWPQVADISVRVVSARGDTYRTVVVTTTAGRRIRLAAPTSGVLTPEEFTASAKQIQDYWRAATAAAGQQSEP
jgi:Bacterial PH domain